MKTLEGITGVLMDGEPEILSELASMVSMPILEIGSYQGLSTVCLAKATTQLVYAIDLWDLRLVGYSPSTRERDREFDSPETWQKFLSNTRKYSNVIPVKGDSKEIGKVWNIPIGLLWIDGDHRYNGIKSDYELYAKHLISGGILAIHDYVIESVAEVIETIIKPSGDWCDMKLVNSIWTAVKVRI